MCSEDQIPQASPPPEDVLDLSKGFACRLGRFEGKPNHVSGRRQVVRALVLPFSYSVCPAGLPFVLLTGGGRREEQRNVSSPLENTALGCFQSSQTELLR